MFLDQVKFTAVLGHSLTKGRHSCWITWPDQIKKRKVYRVCRIDRRRGKETFLKIVILAFTTILNALSINPVSTFIVIIMLYYKRFVNNKI